jgi:hypothetical protein
MTVIFDSVFENASKRITSLWILYTFASTFNVKHYSDGEVVCYTRPFRLAHIVNA